MPALASPIPGPKADGTRVVRPAIARTLAEHQSNAAIGAPSGNPPCATLVGGVLTAPPPPGPALPPPTQPVARLLLATSLLALVGLGTRLRPARSRR